MELTPSYLAELTTRLDTLATDLASLRLLITGGEALPPATTRTWLQHLPGVPITNTYGPTEATICATTHHLTTPATTRTVPIGRPLPGRRVYITDPRGHLLPPGVPGELLIGGPALARGYLNQPALTARKFTPDPYAGHGDRLYHTGDLARWLPDGTLEYLGRTDNQLKIRGIRIEPGEIEAELARSPLIAQAVVVAHEHRPGDMRLISYVVPAPGVADLDTAALRTWLAARVPDYLVPSAFVAVPTIPLTPNGKVDRDALPAPEYRGSVTGRAPATAVEDTLCSLFAEVLGVGPITVDDDFFGLGGHSLLALRLVNRVRTALGLDLSVQDLFLAPTVAGLATHLRPVTQPRPPVTRNAGAGMIPLSFAQQRLWFEVQMEGPSATLNVPVLARLTGRIDTDALQAALNDLVARHEVLRTMIGVAGSVPEQLILPAGRAKVTLDLATARPGEAEQHIAAAMKYVFDVTAEIPVRAWVISTTGDEHVLVLLVHHIAVDGWSMIPLLRDLGQAYTARLAGTAPRWEPLPVQYADYTAWQHELLGDEHDQDSLASRQLDYWRRQLAGIAPELAIPTDRPRPAAASHQCGQLTFGVPAPVYARLTQLARDTQATMFMVIQAALAVLLTRLSGGTDIPIGTAVAGRSDDALDDLVGFFLNTLVLRADTAGDPTFRQLLARIRDTGLGALAHQDIPFERVVELLNPPRSAARHPLFQTMLHFNNADQDSLDLAGVKAIVGGGDQHWVATARFDLTLTVTETSGNRSAPSELRGHWIYASDLFDAATAESMSARFLRLLECFAADPDQPIGQATFLSPAERQLIIADWSGTTEPAPSATLPDATLPDATLPGLLAAQAARTPSAPAVIFDSQQLSYAELDAAATRLARLLISYGTGPETRTAVFLPRSPELVITLIAILKTGGAYVPLDLHYPPARTARMLDDAAPVRIITTRDLAAVLPAGHPGGTEVPRLLIDDPHTLDALARTPAAPFRDTERLAPLRPAHPAYIVYTSGSTGAPKGVITTHRGAVNFLAAMRAITGISPDDRVLAITSSSFDPSVSELFLPLTNGAAVVVLSDDERRDVRAVAEAIRTRAITLTLGGTPTFLTPVAEDLSRGHPHALRLAISTGESVTRIPAECREAFGHLVNMFGPTECTITTTFRDCTADPATGPDLIGRPIRNALAYVLDANLQPVPAGVCGELYFAGPAWRGGTWRSRG